MVMLAIMLIIASGIIEVMMHRQFQPKNYDPSKVKPWLRPFVKRLYCLGPWVEKNNVRSLIFSLGISFVLILLFPAAGLIVLVAGVFSTIATQPYYAAVRRVAQIRATWQRRKQSVKTFFVSTGTKLRKGLLQHLSVKARFQKVRDRMMARF